jgi:hypothetical protein
MYLKILIAPEYKKNQIFLKKNPVTSSKNRKVPLPDIVSFPAPPEAERLLKIILTH